MFAKVMVAYAPITNEFLENEFLEYEICAMFATHWNSIACQGFGFILTWGFILT
jgi:hypothetical protein